MQTIIAPSRHSHWSSALLTPLTSTPHIWLINAHAAFFPSLSTVLMLTSKHCLINDSVNIHDKTSSSTLGGWQSIKNIGIILSNKCARLKTQQTISIYFSKLSKRLNIIRIVYINHWYQLFNFFFLEKKYKAVRLRKIGCWDTYCR